MIGSKVTPHGSNLNLTNLHYTTKDENLKGHTLLEELTISAVFIAL